MFSQRKEINISANGPCSSTGCCAFLLDFLTLEFGLSLLWFWAYSPKNLMKGENDMLTLVSIIVYAELVLKISKKLSAVVEEYCKIFFNKN